jgi:hypothetical protein
MVNVIDGVKQYKYFRKDFTEEERASYNQYVSNRMCAYFKTEKGKLKANENNRKYYYKKKEEALERSRPPLIEINQNEINEINEIEEHEII